MIDWRSLAFNSLWVFAAALALAALSHAAWAASQRSEKFSQALAGAGYRQVFTLSTVLFCLGQAGLAPQIWRLAAWLALAVFFVVTRQRPSA